MQELHFYQSLWATEERRPGIAEAPVEARFERTREAGYHGMVIDLGAMDIEAARATVPLFARYALKGGLTAFPRSIEELRPAIHLAKDIGAECVVVIGQVMPLTVDGMVPVVREWLALARSEGMPIQFETHRNCITNDLFATCALLDAVPEMRLAADLSHYVVDRELPNPPPPWLAALFERVLERSDSLQGRVAARGQIQVPIGFPQNARWLALFLAWWTAGMRAWRRRAGPDDKLVFLCELGPPDYAITDGEGRELSDRWAEALEIRRLVTERWEALAAEAG
jgi:hypothetical protein